MLLFVLDNKDDVYVTLTRAQFEMVLRDLVLSMGYSVHIYSGAGGKANYSDKYLLAKVSPGNYGDYEDILVGVSNSQNAAASPILAAVKSSQSKGIITIGIACIDINTRRFVVLEVNDDEKLANLETILVQLNVKECLLAQGDILTEKISEVCEMANILVNLKKKSDFDTKDLDVDLNKLLRFAKGSVKNSAILRESPCFFVVPLKYEITLSRNETGAGHGEFKCSHPFSQSSW